MRRSTPPLAGPVSQRQARRERARQGRKSRLWVRDIDNYSGAHPCAGVRDKIDELNKATCDHHHGESAEAVPKTGVDPDELKVIVEDTLEVIGAREPSSPPTPARPVPSITGL